jgi:hypothetical protein
MDRFKLLLSGVNWNIVTDSVDVNVAFEHFWAEFKQLYDLCFPLTTQKFNRNTHRVNGYMTAGLLISRSTKNKLHNAAVCYPSPENINTYKLIETTSIL